MATIGRSFDELDKKIKQFNSEIKTSKSEVRDLDKSLKLNPGNVDAVRKKYAALSTQLQANTQKLTALKQKQSDLNRDLSSGAISQQTYERELIKVKKADKRYRERDRKPYGRFAAPERGDPQR